MNITLIDNIAKARYSQISTFLSATEYFELFVFRLPLPGLVIQFLEKLIGPALTGGTILNLVKGPGICPGRQHVAGFAFVFDLYFQHLPDEFFDAFLLRRKHDFNPVIQVSRHPVGAGKIIFIFPAVSEIKDPAVLKIAVNNADDIDVIGADAGFQAADAADNQINFDSGDSRPVEMGDYHRINQRIHFCNDMARIIFG